MLETNVNNFIEENKAHVYQKKIKGDDIINKIDDNTKRVISCQRTALKVHANKLKFRLNYALKKANDAKLDQK